MGLPWALEFRALENSAPLTVELNMEGNPFHEKAGDYPGFIPLIKDIQPAQCTLVPDNPAQKTSDHGWNLKEDGKRLKPIIDELKNLRIRVSIFLDSDIDQIRLAPETGTDRIELYTEEYARLYGTKEMEACFQKYLNAAKFAYELGLGLNAGHDLNLLNLKKFCSIPGIIEVSIGHALISDALIMGLGNAVKAYCEELFNNYCTLLSP